MKYIDIYADGHKGLPYYKTEVSIQQRVDMLPIKSKCEICGEMTHVIDILSIQQIKRDIKIKKILE